MYVVTGGAGFIGSNLVAELSDRGETVAVCDWMRADQRWRNLSKHEICDLISPESLLDWLDRKDESVTAVVHLGAVTDTTETNIDLIAQLNVRATLDLLQWCTDKGTPFIYASSAATYGDGSAGFDDQLDCEALARLRPLNAYGWSKHLVDRRIGRLVDQGAPLPPQCVGLKFFNVYGANEYHKGAMQSVVAQNFDRIRQGGPMRLFRSYRPEYPDGGQQRDFIYVKDCVDVVIWLLEHPDVSGLYNVGSGAACSWLDVTDALYRAVGLNKRVEFCDMPASMIDRYQYFTQARMERLRKAGYRRQFTSLEDGVTDYVKKYLDAKDPYR